MASQHAAATSGTACATVVMQEPKLSVGMVVAMAARPCGGARMNTRAQVSQQGCGQQAHGTCPQEPLLASSSCPSAGVSSASQVHLCAQAALCRAWHEARVWCRGTSRIGSAGAPCAGGTRARIGPR